MSQFWGALVYAWCWVGVLYGHRVQVAKITNESKLSPFLLAMSTPQAQSDLEVYHVVFEQHFYLRWVLFRFMWCRSPCALPLAPSLRERRLLLVRFRARQNYNNQYPPYVLKNRLHFDWKPLMRIQNLPPLFYIWNALSLAKLVCQTLVQMKRCVPENSSCSTGRHPFRISLKAFYSKISIY